MGPTWPSVFRNQRAAGQSGAQTCIMATQKQTLISHRDFVNDVQSKMQTMVPGMPSLLRFTGASVPLTTHITGEDGLSDDNVEHANPIMLPPPELGNLAEIENHIRAANATQNGRDALGKFIVSQEYIAKLLPLVEMAEDLESLSDLHRLCSIMKMLILLNDTAIIEYVVTDDALLRVVGALECEVAVDPLAMRMLTGRRRSRLPSA